VQLTPQQRQGVSGKPRLVIAVKHCDLISSGYPCTTTLTESESLHSPHVQKKKKEKNLTPKKKRIKQTEEKKQKKPILRLQQYLPAFVFLNVESSMISIFFPSLLPL